jgi:gluconate 2-dehydrogenase gamma chain
MVNRREFMAAGALAGAALAASTTACRRSSYGVLTEAEASTLAILCDQIIPADDYPSASQAGVLTYIDHQLIGPYRRHRRAYASGLKQANLLSRTRFGIDLAAASPSQQFEIVTALEGDNKSFFDLVRNHTMQGYYGSPRHGGNRDATSWRMLGLDEPPVRGRAQYDLTQSEMTGGSKS